MTTLVLHIGISKTGSTAIQQALRGRRAWLAEQGVHYALARGEDAQADGKVISGNGGDLARLLDPNVAMTEADWPSRAEFEAQFLARDLRISLISSESLANADADRLLRFRDTVVGDADRRIVAFVRDLYGHARSSWMQQIKRHGYSDDFAKFCRRKYANKQCAALRRYAEVFGPEAMTVIHYDSNQHDLMAAFAGALAIDWPADEPLAPVNRSLSAQEVRILALCNRVHAEPAALSKVISDHLIGKRPDKPKAAAEDGEALALLAERFAGDVDWVNATFFGGEARLSVGGSARVAPENLEPPQEVWLDIVEGLGDEVVRLAAENAALRSKQTALKQALAEKSGEPNPLRRLMAKGRGEA